MQPIADLSNCEQEPVQWPGFIQSHGYLLALHPDTFEIWQASENVSDLAQRPLNELIGLPVEELLLGNLPGIVLQELLTVATRNGNPEAFSSYQVTIYGTDWFVLLHRHDGALLLELEPVAEPSGVIQLSTQALLAQTATDIQRSTTLAELLAKTAVNVKAITGFDRVMIYRFGEDWHGEVIAEAREEYLEPFLGLHYPASDIPKQARDLYKINLVRGIVDVQQPRVGIYPTTYFTHNRPLDLTHAHLRAVSPMHVEYLQNMGVRSSMSISLLDRGELWGLIACHHYAGAHFIDYPARQSIKLVSQLLSATLEIRHHDELAGVSEQLLKDEQTIYQQMMADWDVVQGLTKHRVTVLDLTNATGAALLFEGQLHTLGQVPTEADTLDLIEWLKSTTTDNFFQTPQLPDLYPPAAQFREKAAGLLMIVLSREMNEYLLWFKPEQLQTVFWGGNPDKQMSAADQGLRPRKSFERWSQLVRNKALPWQQAELSIAFKLREDLLQVVALKANQIRTLNEQLRLAYEELEAFSYTVSHDLRAPLSSIKSYSEIYLEDYGDQMEADAQAIFGKVIQATDRMSMLIRNVMQYARMSRIDLTATQIPIKPLLNQILEEGLLVGDTKPNVQITVGQVPDLYGDQIMIAQVFSNLIANAIKYSRHVPQPRVSIQSYENEHEVVYSVSDNGIGIDMKQTSRVFELFQRLDSAAQYDGYGVGLAIVRRIMNRHRGKIWFESLPYQETTFFVSFPKLVVQH